MKRFILALVVGISMVGCGGGGGGGSTEEPQNTPAQFSGDTSASLATNQTTVSGSLTIVDPDASQSSAISQTNAAVTYGTFSITTAGQWQYTLDVTNSAFIALAAGVSVTETVTVRSVDSSSQVISITINGINDAPTFGSGDGINSATIERTLSVATTGSITISDPDTVQETFVSQTNTTSTYGTFSITAAGAWTYTLDTSNSTVAGLTGKDDTITDEIMLSSADGTRTTISITITGLSANQTPALTKGSIGTNDTVPTINCTTTVSSTSALESAVSFSMTPGDTICLDSGNYGDLDISFGGVGTANLPITVAAAVPGNVTIGGESHIGMTGTYIVFQGFIFKDGSMDSSLIQTRANSNTACNNCRITDNAFINMDEGLDDSTKWFQIYGSNNRFDHNWVSGKTTRGALFIVERGDAPGTEDRTQIDHNYFGDRPPINGVAYADNSDNEYEGIRIGSSDTHTSNSFAVIEHNYFEAIDGEAEVISVKAGGVKVIHNTIRNSRGSIVSRHGEGTIIDNNFILGDDNPFSGGVRVVDANHSVTNNYIQGARNPSSNFYGGILISSSDGSTSNGYQDVENVLVANNTVVDSVNSINLFAGNESSKPDTIYFANNVVASAIGSVFRNADTLPVNSAYAGNFVFGQSFSDDSSVASIAGVTFGDPVLSEDSQGIYRPTTSGNALAADMSASTGSFALPLNDMDGQTRSNSSMSGADEISSQAPVSSLMRGVLSPALVGPLSFTPPATSLHIKQVAIANANFDNKTLASWNNTGGVVISAQAEVFSRESSVKLDDATDKITQTVTVEANTNYTLSAFVKGVSKLGAKVNGTSYSVDENTSEYRFSSVSFNSNAGTSVEISASIDDLVLNHVAITNSNFDNKQSGWVVNEGTGIGQVQDSSNSASGADGSIKFIHNKPADSGNPYQPYIAQTVTVLPNTEYTLSMYILLKSGGAQDTTVLFGAHTGSAISDGVFDNTAIIKSKDSVFANLSEADKGDDSFRPDSLTFNSGVNTTITIFAQYQTTVGDEIRIDDFSLTAQGAPVSGAEAFFDSFRLVSHPSLN